MQPGVLLVRNAEEADTLVEQVRASATKLQSWISSFGGDGIGLLRALKFDQIGFHPLDGHALSAIEQVNQTWTYRVALSAVRLLLDHHPDSGGFRIAPGAHAAQPLDVMSEVPGLVGAETFAAVDPANNRKLAQDLGKLVSRTERHRYVFFASPKYPGTVRLQKLERDGVQVWSVDV
jgi:hypothetical protein